MYINISVISKSGLEYSDLIFLCAISQTETDWLIENLKESVYERFERLSLIKHIKQKSKKEHLYTSLRLSDSGKRLLKDLQRIPEALEDDIIVKDWLINYYKSVGKEIGSEKRIEQYLVNFRVEAGIYKNNIVHLLRDFLSDTSVDESSKVLESILFQRTKKTMDTKGSIVYYEVPWNLEESWLYKHYKKKEEYFKSIFEEY